MRPSQAGFIMIEGALVYRITRIGAGQTCRESKVKGGSGRW